MAKQKNKTSGDAQRPDGKKGDAVARLYEMFPYWGDDIDEAEAEEILAEFGERDEPPDEEEIEEQRRHLLERQQNFVMAAEWISRELSTLPWVRRVVLFGSAANPLKEEVPRFREYRRWKIALPHECGDVDMAVWLDDFTELGAVQKAEKRALNALAHAEGFHIAPHQVDMFLHDSANGAYAGRLCDFNTCPKGKPECLNDKCGSIPFLKIIPKFVMYSSALKPDRSRVLFDRDL